MKSVFDVSHPTINNSQRLYTVTELTNTGHWYVNFRQRPDSMHSIVKVSSVSSESRERTGFARVSRRWRAESGPRILFVLDNFSSHICAYIRESVHEPGILPDLSFSWLTAS